MKYNPLPSTISFGATTFIYQKTRRCPTAIILEIYINLFLERDYGSCYNFPPSKGGLHFAKCFFFFAQKCDHIPTALHRTHWPCCSVAEQHANTQSFICEVFGYMIPFHFSHSLGSWFSYPWQQGKNGKYEFNLLYFFYFFLAFMYPKITFYLLCHYAFFFFLHFKK